MKLKTTILCFFFAYTMFGQNTFRISGKIRANDSQESISFANVVLISDDTIVKGSSSDDLGFFNIEGVIKGKYILKISFIGYKILTKYLDISKNVDLGIITLEEDIESLENVTISAKKPTLKREIDRLVFTIEGTALVEDNTWEVLRRTPGVIVIDNTLSIKNSTPTVYINDRKVHLSSNEVFQLLEGTPAKTIKSIEVITNPPAKYDAQGGTILNIVMSKNLITGYHGSVYTNYTQGVFSRYNAGMSHFYKRNKVNLFASYNYTHNKIKRENHEEINYLDTGVITSEWDSEINRIRRSDQHNFNLNADYTIDDKNTLSFTGKLFYLPYWKRDTQTNSLVDDRTALNEDFSLVANNITAEDKHNLGLNLDYVHSFKREGEKLSANMHYTDYDGTINQDVSSNYIPINSPNFDTRFMANAHQKTNIISGKIDYEIPLSDSATFETGVKAASIETKSRISQFDIINGSPQVDLTNTDAFNYNEDIYAAYVSYAKQWEKWRLKLGFRGEQTELKGNSLVTNQLSSQNYFELFPTAYLTYSISNNVNIYVDYSRRISRPNYQDLNPFRYYFTDFSFASGDSQLQPAISNNYKIGAKISDTYFIEAFYSRIKNEIYELTIQDNTNGVIQYLASNVENNRYYGIDFITYFSMAKNWDVSITTSIYNNEDTFTTAENITVTRDKWANYTNIDNNFTFLKDRSLTANVSFTYLSPVILGLSENSDRNYLSISFRKSVFNKKGLISLSFNDILNGQEFTKTTGYVNQLSSYRANFDRRTFKIGFRYKFGNTSLKTNERSKSSKERSRIKS